MFSACNTFRCEKVFRRESVGFRTSLFLRADWRAKSVVLSERKLVFFRRRTGEKVGKRWERNSQRVQFASDHESSSFPGRVRKGKCIEVGAGKFATNENIGFSKLYKKVCKRCDA